VKENRLKHGKPYEMDQRYVERKKKKTFVLLQGLGEMEKTVCIGGHETGSTADRSRFEWGEGGI